MGEPFDIFTDFSGGLVGSQIAPSTLGPSHLITPTENVWYTVLKQLQSFQGCKSIINDIGGPVILLVGATWATLASGNVIMYTGKSLWFIGTGTVRTTDPLNSSVVVSIGVASSVLQVSVLKNNVYQSPLQAGLLAPPAPSLTANPNLGPGFTGKNTGTFGAQITEFRSATGAESNGSEPSNVVSCNAESIYVTFPPPPIDGSDQWNFYPSANGFGGTGPYLYLTTIDEIDLTDTATGTINIGTSTTVWTRTGGHTLTASDVGKQIVIAGAGAAGATLTTKIDAVDVGLQTATLHDPASTSVTGVSTTLNAFAGGIPRTVEIEWADGELILAQKAPIDHDLPPSGKFVFAIGNVMCVVGCYDGLGVACSIPGQPEAFNPDYVSFLPEPVVNIVGRPQDGYVFLICANSVHAAVYTGAVVGPPVMVRTLWDKVGSAGFGSACVHGGTLFIFTGDTATKSNKIARTNSTGELDYSFSYRIATELKTWNPQAVAMGYDDNRKAVCAIYNQELFSYHDDLDVWGHLNFATVSGVGNPTGNIVGAYTQNGRLYLLAFEAGKYNLYLQDEAPGGTSVWKFTIGWQNGLSMMDNYQRSRREHLIKTLKEIFFDYSSLTDITLTANVYADLDMTAPVGSFTATLAHTKKMLRWLRANIVMGRLFTLTISGAGANQLFYALQMKGTTSNIRN